MEAIRYYDEGISLGGRVFRPARPPRAAVAVFPTIMNPTPAVIAKAENLAAAGYAAMVCDFYGSTPANFAESVDMSTRLRADPTVYRRRLHAALAALSEAEPGVPRCAIGFCMGGQAVLELARDGADLAAVASFHGLLDTQRPAEPGAVRARVLVCHGDADSLVPRSQVLTFWGEMDRAGADWHFHAYSGVGHGFTNPNPPPAGGPPAYDASADRQSWAAMLSFFDEALGER